MYAYWVSATRETPIFSPEFPFRSISFSQITKKIRSGASPFYIFGGFCRSETIIFKIYLNITRSSPPTAGSARTQSVRQRRGLAADQSASQTRPGSSGDSHFHAQIGSSSFWSPAFSRPKRLQLVPERRIFKLRMAQARSGAPHFHARPGARSGAWAHFPLCRGTYMYLPKFGVSTPPPPRGSITLGRTLSKSLIINRFIFSRGMERGT